MNVEQTMGEQMEERSFHTGGVTGSIPVAPTTQTQTNTGFAASDKGVNAGSAEPSTTLADRYGAGPEKVEVAADAPRAHPWHTIVQRLNTKADMLTMGEQIAYGSDSAIMREAAAEIERLRDWDRKWCEYSIDLQRIIEALCSGREIPKPETTAQHHYEMAVKYRAPPGGPDE